MTELTADEFMTRHREPVLTAVRCMVVIARGSQHERAKELAADAEALSAQAFVNKHHGYLLSALNWLYMYCLYPPDPPATWEENPLYFAWGGRSDWPQKFETSVWRTVLEDAKQVVSSIDG